jgi:hypothetical protein
MKTIVLHPKDDSTTFLDTIYKGIPSNDITLITEGKTKKELIDLFELHDRIINMGHGSPFGLFSVGKFINPYVIDGTYKDIFNKKKNNILIWCNADEYVKKYGIRNVLYSGMFISEVGEGRYCGIYNTTQYMVDESNRVFSEIMGEYINEENIDIFIKLKTEYKKIIDSNPVAEYNYYRLYLCL